MGFMSPCSATGLHARQMSVTDFRERRYAVITIDNVAGECHDP